MRENLYTGISGINVDVKEQITNDTIFNKIKVKKLITIEKVIKRSFDIIGSIFGIALLIAPMINVVITGIGLGIVLVIFGLSFFVKPKNDSKVYSVKVKKDKKNEKNVKS